MHKSVLFLTACVLAASIAQADWVTTTVAIERGPNAVAVNPATNKIYVACQNVPCVMVIDGSTCLTTQVSTEAYPRAIAVNPVTNRSTSPTATATA